MKNKLITRRRLLTAGALFAAGTAVEGYGLTVSRGIRVTKRELRLPKWKADGFRIAQISDIHCDMTYDSAMPMALESARLAVELKPDVILFTGDFVTASSWIIQKRVPRFLEVLSDASCPIYGVFGNHDWSYGVEHLLPMLVNSPIRMLQNEAIEVGDVLIAGADDGMYSVTDLRFLQEHKDHPSQILMWHEPDMVDLAPGQVSIQLSGHSHGGEICLPGGIALHTPEGAKKYIAGFYERPQGPPLFVSRGVGTIGPCRIYCQPEICLLTLRSA